MKLWRALNEKRQKVISFYYSDRYIQVNVRWDLISSIAAAVLLIVVIA